MHDDYIGDDSLHSSLDNIHSDKKKDLAKIASRQRLGHKTTLSQAKPVPFSHIQIEDPKFEVTNDSRLPLKINDAKLLHVLEWKREKERMMNERNKQIMDKLQRRMESSSVNRQFAMIEEVRHKARMTNNGGDHLKKWRLKVQTLREEEERGAQGYIEEIERRKEAERQRSELCRSV